MMASRTSSWSMDPAKEQFIFEFGDLDIKVKFNGDQIMGRASLSALVMATLSRGVEQHKIMSLCIQIYW
jgi:hypothetical protein